MLRNEGPVHGPASPWETDGKPRIRMNRPAKSPPPEVLEDFYRKPDLTRLSCGIQHYAWGGTQFLPRLLGRANPEDRPYAELWMGAHPDLPSQVQLGEFRIPLDAMIAGRPERILGNEVAMRYEGRLPYLFKVLSATKPLSIQVHPSRQNAETGFDRETAAGIPMDFPERNYKDRNHKPELIAALTEMYALRGFRPLAEIDALLSGLPEFGMLRRFWEFSTAGLRRLYEYVMQLPQDEVDSLLLPLMERLLVEHAESPFPESRHEYWALRAHEVYSSESHCDRGIFSVFLLNLVVLRPDEAMYLPAGELHAYLEGSGIEIMANSNNVLRGGLTPKHVDVPELLANVVFEGRPSEIIHPAPQESRGELLYPAPAEEFELRRIDLSPSSPYEAGAGHPVEILIVIRTGNDPVASIRAESAATHLELRRGEVVLVPADLGYTLVSEARSTLYKATVPKH